MSTTPTVEYVPAPMLCCGLGMASGITNPVATGERRDIVGWDGKKYGTEAVMRSCTPEDVKTRLEKVKEFAAEDSRNCVMITLSSDQERYNEAVTLAKEAGFKVIQEFYNPNSGNTVYIMTYTQYATYEEFSAAGDDEDF